jgi:class 3 adenylate cyclase
MALFVPGFAGADYRRKAVEGARSLRIAVGRSSELGLDIGIGIASGEEFIGDVTNLAARLTAAAEAEEILVEAESYDAVASVYPSAEVRVLEGQGQEHTRPCGRHPRLRPRRSPRPA